MLSNFALLLIVSSLDTSNEQNPTLAKPTLSLDPPWDVILPGEEFSLTCRFSHTSCSVEFNRVNESGNIGYFTEVDYTAIFKHVEDKPSNGRIDYTCKYRKYFENINTWAESPQSEPVGLTVKDTLPKAGISLDPAAGLVGRGQTFRITCTGDIRPSGGQIHLYREDDEKPAEAANVTGSQRSAGFTITDTDTAGTRNYTCAYQRTVKQRTYRSPHSDPVRVTVTDTPSRHDQSERKVWLSAGCAVMVIVLLLLAVALFMFCKKKEAPHRPDRNEPAPAEPEIVYASLNTVALNQRAMAANAKAHSPPEDPETCVYAVMKVK